MIAASGIRVERGGRCLLDIADLSLDAACFTVILGPNGAGKSTLLNTLSGDTKPDSGSVHICGQDAQSWSAPALSRRRAVLIQSQELNFPLKVYEVVALGGVARDRSESAADIEAAQQLLEDVGAGHLATRWFPTLSGGEQQRVHLARTLYQVGTPLGPEGANILMLDEPTSNLDIARQIEALEIARRFATGGGLSLAVLHDPLLARAHADRLLFLSEGRLIGDISADDAAFETLCMETYHARFDRDRGHWVKLGTKMARAAE